MNTLEFLSRLRKLGVKLSIEDQKLRLNAPQGVLTPFLRTELKDRKVELLNFLREQQQTGVAVPPPIRPTERSSDMHLSFAQQRLWFLNQMEPEHPVYNVPMAFRLSGLLSIEALSQGFADMIARHEILRTTFSTLDGQPVQIIHESVDQPLSIRDFQHLPEDKREIEVENAVKQEITKPFDLKNGPLFRTKLLRLAASEHILLILTHHIVFDGWSYEILCHELTTLYASKVTGQPQQLPKLPIQYADFAAWQREWLRGPSLETQVEYWHEQLADAPTVLQLPTDRPHSAVQRLQGRSYSFALPLELSNALHTFSQQEGSTLFITGLASFMVLLYRYTRQKDLIVGTPITNRSHVELEGLIGPLINTLALRAIISESLSFRELLAQVRQTALAAYDHQDLPFEKLVEVLQLERDISHTPLFQVMFVLQQATPNLLALTGLEVSEIELESDTAKFDLTLTLIEVETGVRGQLEYSTDLFDDATIARLIGHYETLLESIVANPEQRISDVQILTDTERQQMLIDWNDASSKYPRDRCVHQLFEQQVEQIPDAVAVVYGDKQLTYRELNARANQLAHYLKSFGVGPEVLVGICLERSLEMVIAVLGILKAGGAYVPLDPEYPQDRLGFMLADTGSPVLLTHSRLMEELPRHEARVICIDSDWDAIGRHSEETPVSATSVENLAYVIYTSGSTGKPKGVAISHGGMLNLVFWHRNVFEVTASDRATQLAGTAFDASVWEVWPYLTAGARLHVVSAEKLVSPEQLRDWLVSEEITLTFLPTPLAEQVLKLDWPQQSPLRTLLTGGDKLHRSPPESIPFKVINNYGPTENTVVTTSGVVLPNSDADIQPHIGCPISNTEVYVLDERLGPVPVGVPGELCIGGESLARGYLNRPNLTAENFIPNPYSDTPGARLYKSGDLVRYLQDGSIEFLGRIDHQVKIRGFRIELGEVESVLGRHPAVEEAVVIAREDVPGDKRLVAYVVASDESTPTFSDLRSFLKEKLPDYMIPTAFVYMDSLPLTPNGKVDRRTLPAPDVVRPDLQEAFVAPRSQSEELVAGIWSNMLGLERIGVYDSFFELGGHSLLAVQIISRIREVFAVELPLRALFEAPTVARFTERIETAHRRDEGLQTYPLQAVYRDQDLPLSFSQERLWFLHHLEPDSVAYSMPRSIRLKGVLRKDALEKTYVELARRHETLRTTFQSTDGNPVLRIAAEPNILFDTVDLRHLPGVERESEAMRLSAEDARKPFDLARGPLFRIRLFQLGDEEHVLHFNMHHIISDGWSFGVMAREIATLYTAFIKNEPADLPELPVQYADYGLWQRQWFQGEALEAQLNYWKDQLGGELPVLELPTDRPRPAVQTHRGAIESLALTKELTDALQAMSRREGVTLFMTLLAAFKTLLYRLTGQEDTIVGTPIAGRNRTELEGLIGFFINTIVMRTDLSGNPTFRELLGRVRETALGAYAHQDMPFERLVEELAPERDLSRTPLFQIFFNHIVAIGDKAEELPGLETEAVVGLEDRESKFDMTLYVLEREGGIELRSSYNTDLFDSWRTAAMLKQYQMLLASIVSDSDQRISELSLLTEAERHQILVDWNDTAADYPEDKCIHTLFETQAEHSPEAVAVIFGDEQLSYHELNCRANQLAHYLTKHGVGSEQVVGICMERSFEMIIGLLAVSKAGGAYVALEPDFPGARLSFMLEDTKPGLLLTQEGLLEKIPEYSGEVVCLDRDSKLFENEKASNLEPITTPEDLAYVTYTSGSTGKPKGILTSHLSVVQNLHALIHNYSLSATDIVLQLSSFSFDASVRDMFGPLLAGARMVVVRNDEAKDPSALVAKIAENHVTCILSIVPSQLTQLVEAGFHKSFSFAALHHISAAGEPLPMALCKRAQDVFGCSVVNQYGPTECTMISSYHRVVDLDGNRNIALIGRPIANTQFYILDNHLNPVPVGVAGEAHIGGLGVSKGYLNLPDLTAEKFIPNPYSNEPEARLYKTGDMVRFLPDGTMEFLGRRDFQVKLRGVRIELGEVEATLCLHPSVSEAVVVAREDRPGDKRLVAYVVAAAAESVPSTGVLRAFLQEKLPDYMIPSAFVFLDALPLTANRKVDRRALPAPDRMRPELAEVFIAPRTQTEELVAGIWSNVLGLERIGVYDSFFELGGHSLLVVQIVSRIREVFEVELPVRALFEAPTVARFTERIETAHRRDEGLQTSPLQAVSRDQDLPLSFAQERLWFLHHLEPESVAYSMPRSIRLKGMLRKDALEKTYVELARRHETLRTTFQSTDGKPVLRIAAEPNILFDTVDLRHLPGAEREAEARRLSSEDARKPFDLTRGPLFRVLLFQIEDEEHVLHFNMHHIISDGWSFGVMAREIATLYTAFIKNEPADLPELPVQYADYGLWQRQWFQGEALEAQLNYWKDQLGGELPVLELPTDRPRPAVQTHRGAMELLALTKELTDALQAMSRREGVTLFMTLLAAFKTLLYRLTGQEDIIVGTPIAGRNRTELEGLIGFFMNTIVMRTDLSRQPTFRELLGRVRETALGAYANQDMPFERLVEELAPERDLSRTPLFQVFFNHIVAMGDKAEELPGLKAETVDGLEDRESKFDMSLTVLEGEGGLAARFEYSTDLFDTERIERMVGNFQTLLEGIVADPEKCIGELPILDEAERRQLLVEWNDTAVEYPRYKCINEFFEKQVEDTPDATAVIFGKQQLTYRELNARANQLAHYLQSQGVVAESRVGIWMDRSPDMMVALLGTLKAGGACVPLDPSYPQERLAFMLEDAQAPVLLTREKFLEDLPAYAGHVVCLDKDYEAIASRSEENPISGITADSAAYVIYTSGSTGTPKGVIGLHRGAVNRLSWMWRVYPFKDGEVCCQKTYLSFVDSVWEIFGPLLKGVPAIIIPEEVVKDPHLLVDNLAAARVSRIVLVPSLLRVLLESFGDLQKRLLDSKIWVTSGEEISVELAQRFRQVMPEAKLINLYGSSEVSADVTCYEVADGMLHRCIPIGRPIDNTSIYILDSHLQPVPIGVPGELYIGGAGLAQGYLNQPDLTAERFIPSPFGQEEVLFKTGDLGRYLPDGNIEYLGRRDHQVKVRGFRIELGEIESQIKGLEAVSNCVVVLREDRPADQRLTAYYVCKEGQAVSESEVRRQLQAKLPDYMLPQHFVELSSIPLTPNGKVDRKALPKPEAAGSLEQGYVEPRTEAEQKIASVWQEVLNTERVGVHDDFFELGGHSLLATQVMSRINRLFNIQLPLRRFFEAKTVEALAEVIDISLWNAEGLQKPGITGTEEREVIEL